MKQILQFIGQNKYVLTIGFIAFIIQFEGLVYLMSHKQSDFSYSGHEFEWFDGDAKKTILAILAFTFWYSHIWSLYFPHVYSNSAIERL